MDRLGFVKRWSDGKRILVHTVSVGEFLGAAPFINALRDKYPGYEIVVSTTTVTGNKVARARIGNVVYFPLDFWFSVRRFLDRVSPCLIILVETELWPNFLTISKILHIPVLVVNGRISEHSYKNYSILKGFFRRVCSGIRLWGVQFERDRERLVGLGIDKDKIHVTGSIKFDAAIQGPQVSREDGLVLVGGSTHEGEEKILLDIYREIKGNFRNLKLILVPRHPERCKEIKRLIKAYNGVTLVDKVGELPSIYSKATVVFIGKSLVKGGGQNLLEPAGLGKPVICGPMMWNFQDITQWLVENGGVVQVRDKTELKQAIVHLLNSPDECARLGARARELVLKASGAVGRNLNEVCKIFT